ncbi:hypothetical protein [Paenibacillus sp. MMS18-CY102]|uniref:hypothetical protein n=1 Tax=Paenibacillus sp. MMS18-CY102 TaxID=2682849 RepID=UPI0013663C6C|nr:hypothetical protein [Paenibacillus sp. MMS18-CY102]MWC26798.1 hypothetical protein [Paenibacillus sp. MMS18-CY102]
MKFSWSAWAGAAVGALAALLLCVLAFGAAHGQSWFGQSKSARAVLSDVYSNNVTDRVYGELPSERGNGAQSPSNRVDELYSPTITDEKSEESSD